MKPVDYDDRIFRMSIPACEEFTAVACNAIKGSMCAFGIALDILDDVAIASKEALHYLYSQCAKAYSIQIECMHQTCGFIVEFMALSTTVREHKQTENIEITRGILETLVPKVNILNDERGVFCITFFFPSDEDCQ